MIITIAAFSLSWALDESSLSHALTYGSAITLFGQLAQLQPSNQVPSVINTITTEQTLQLHQ